MNQITDKEYAASLDRFARQYPNEWAKYDSTENAQWIVGYLVANQLPPSMTSVRQAIAWLVENERIERTDGLTDADDAQAAVAAANANLEKVIRDADAPPLTKAEIEEIQAMNPADLARKYWENDGYSVFATRYRKAAREWQFPIPPKPTPIEMEGGIELTADEYRKMPAAAIQSRQRDPRFRAAVERLIAAGEIR